MNNQKMFRFKMAAQNGIFISRKKEFFNKIWLKVEVHEYIYILEIKFEKYYSV